jgi:integrase
MLVFWLVNEEVLKDTPRCLQLKGTKYTFPVVRQKPKTVALDAVHKILNAASPRLKLCILLTLNCGFGASEIGKLRKDEYDSVSGRIHHKRCKTEKSDRVPTVCYKLWDETKELLDQAIADMAKYPKHSGTADYLLVNSNGMPLWSESIDKGKSDNITSAFKRLIIKLRKNDPDFPHITYYEFRRTSSTLVYNEPKYRIYNGLWLGHAPQTVAEQHYSVAAGTRLDACIDWLRSRFFCTVPALDVLDDVNMEKG